jgi:L-threo-3-deoxy-hexylosonate aldolase
MTQTNGAVNEQSATNGTNGTAPASERRPLLPGIYAPTLTFFNPETEDLDLPIIEQHAVRLASAGLKGLVTMGSNGEAIHLTSAEKDLVTKTTRSALDKAGYTSIPIIAGCSAGSVRETLLLCEEAAAAGAEYTLLLPPSYFRGKMDNEAISAYFRDVADKSVLPIIIYNYPGAVSGIDLDSDVLIELAAHPNIIGTKFTCANTGKLTRVALATNAVTPNDRGSGYMAFGGMCDFTVQTLVSGGSGIIAGGANAMPKVCVKVWDLWTEGKWEEAIELQKKLSKGDWVLTKGAVPGTKAAIQAYFGYGGYPRRPLRRVEEVGIKALVEGVKEIIEIEKSL